MQVVLAKGSLQTVLALLSQSVLRNTVLGMQRETISGGRTSHLVLQGKIGYTLSV